MVYWIDGQTNNSAKMEITTEEYFQIVAREYITVEEYNNMTNEQRKTHNEHVKNFQIDRLQYGLKQ